MTERKMKRNQFTSIVKTSSSDCEKNERRLNDSKEQTTLSSSRASFFRNALCLFVIVATSNNETDETYKPTNHASLLSFERFSIAESIWFNFCINFQQSRCHFFSKSQKFVIFRLSTLFWKFNSELRISSSVYFLEKKCKKIWQKKLFSYTYLQLSLKVHWRMSLIAKNWWLFSRHIVSSRVLPNWK